MDYADHLDRSLGPRTTGSPSRSVSDEEILAYAAQPYSKEEFSFRRVILGQRGRALVVADYPCSDECPENTVRLVHYPISNLEDCERAGGVVRGLNVIYGIGRAYVRLCFPRVLVENWQTYIR